MGLFKHKNKTEKLHVAKATDTTVPVTLHVEMAAKVLRDYIKGELHTHNKKLGACCERLINIKSEELNEAIYKVCNGETVISLGQYDLLMYNYGIFTGLCEFGNDLRTNCWRIRSR